MKELTASFGKYLGWICMNCGCHLELRKTEITYLGSVFTLELPSCPSCGLTFVPEELALGKMYEVEQILEDK